MAKGQLRGRTETITFVYLYIGAKDMLERAEASREGQLYTVTAALIFCAFTLEAYISHLGATRHPDWETRERKKSAKDKLKALAREVGMSVDFGKPPYSTMRSLFDFRETMAHGRTTRVSVKKAIVLDGPRLPQLAVTGEWQSLATIENARQALKDVETIVKALHTGSGFAGNPFANSGGGFYAITCA